MSLAMAAMLALSPAPRYVLIVTWFNGSQSNPETTRTDFSSAARCQAAKAAVVAEGQRIEQDIARREAELARHGNYWNPVIPRVSVVCAPR